MVTAPATDRVWEALERVADPEIPAISIVDLGIVEVVEVDGNRVEVKCLPTFVGCPALDMIKKDAEASLREAGFDATVTFVYSPPWTSERITEKGRARLEEYGLAPPTGGSPAAAKTPLLLLAPGKCPYCGSTDTILESPFGPTLCRATSYCRSCRNPFEQFKNV